MTAPGSLEVTAPVSLAITTGGVSFRNPILTASGTFGYGKEFENLTDLGAIGGGIARSVRTDHAPRARAVVNHHGLTHGLTEFVSHQTRNDIRRNASRKWDDDFDGAVGVVGALSPG